MKKNGFIKKSLWMSIMLLLLLPVAAEDNAPFSSIPVCTSVYKEPQFFTRELIIELEHANRVDIREIKRTLEAQLIMFFESYAYYDNLASLFDENINLTTWDVPRVSINELAAIDSELQNSINTKLYSLDQKEEAFFKDLKISTENFYTFENDKNSGINKYRSFLTVNLDCKTPDKDQDLLLFLLSAGLTLKNRIKTTDSLCNDGFLIKAVYVNWAFVNQEYVFTGGTGGLPVSNPGGIPCPCYDITCHAMGNPISGKAFGILKEHIANPGNSPVDVYIMDTIPTPEKIQYAWLHYCPVNGLAQELLYALNIQFNIAPYTAADYNFVYLPNEKSCSRDMSDHGIYIAGIIKNLAPFANVHLLEVLNHYGSGTLESLLWGYRYALQKQQEKVSPFIINNSLTSKIVLYKDQKTRYTIIKEFTGRSSILPVFYAMEQPAVFFPALTYVINSLSTCNGILSAAAGNDALGAPGYPAALGEDPAFSHVLAVGAFNGSGCQSSFSNSPGTQGILAYGGETDINRITTEGTNSLYFNKYYAGNSAANASGWARWAGSSFSTGIASGALAALLSRGLYTAPAAVAILKDSCCLNPANMKLLPVF